MIIHLPDDIGIFALHKAIIDRIEKIERDIRWYQRMSTKDDTYMFKCAVYETELLELLSLRELTSKELTLRDYQNLYKK